MHHLGMPLRQAYGLVMQSELDLPELSLGSGDSDIQIKMGSVLATLPKNVLGDRYVRVTPHEALLYWPQSAAFLVRDGREILIDPVPGIEERAVRLLLLGAVIATLMYQRGFFIFHASSVEIAQGAVAFLGWKGAGKSTITGTLYQHGHRLIADDVTAISLKSSQPIVYPGYPQLKLWPDSASSLGSDVAALPTLHPLLDKRSRRADTDFSLEPLPLRRLYVLAEGETLRSDRLTPQEAFVEIMRHSYANHFLYEDRLLTGTGTTARHFQQCAALAAQIPVHRLRRPLDLTRLTEVAAFVEQDLA